MKQMSDNSPLKIVFVIRQPGPANAFISLIQAFRKENWKIVVLAYKNGANILAEKKINYFEIQSFEEGATHLGNSSIILTSTSLNVTDDNKYWDWAKRNQIKAAAFVDSWVSYWQRFTIEKKLDAVPNFVMVIDELMKNRMIEEGMCPEKIVITGSPAFDHLLKKRKLNCLTVLKKEVLIITDPILSLYGTDAKKQIGYTEFEVLDSIFASLHDILADHQKMFSVTIKIHPREKIQDYEEYIHLYGDRFKKIQIIAKTNNNVELIQSASVILGMNSILLLEASILGKKVISFQPNRKKANDITDEKKGIDVITQFKLLKPTLAKSLKPSNKHNIDLLELKNSTTRFVSELKKLVQTEEK